MAAKGRLLTRGDTWGHESILLVSQELMDPGTPSTLSYVNAMTLDKGDLREVAHHFPSFDRKLRRTQIRIAVRRAVILCGYHQKMVNHIGSIASAAFLST